MDFIEGIFGISPDAGSGAFEVVLFLIPLLGLYCTYRARSRKRNRSD